MLSEIQQRHDIDYITHLTSKEKERDMGKEREKQRERPKARESRRESPKSVVETVAMVV